MGSFDEKAAVAARPRSFVRVAGRDAEAYLNRMVSNDVAALPPGASIDALLLTPKARVIAPLRILRRGSDDFLLLTEAELGEPVRAHLIRGRFAAKVEIELEEHFSQLLFGDLSLAPTDALALPNPDYGVPCIELLDAGTLAGAEELAPDELERLRIAAGTPAVGRELDERVLPAEAGLVERAVSFAKGCYPGQEPVARLYHRGHANRGLRVLRLETEATPGYDAEIEHGSRVVGRITSTVRDGDGVLALGYVRVEVPADAVLQVGGVRATQRAVESVGPRP